eukprot:CAMPEP_0197609464 /NCGR_PEP_ID=MMETSP1326-20131121/51262_1 /TAXON_ID=1155430 /ORGANISM="Genus nov. species nov., Strain RCC2288" /LENGTH=73 /DNA_ID=CAMNT_0043177841 /DNA_START=77 /DNA_END=294 /DNA_ORIENTATION=+
MVDQGDATTAPASAGLRASSAGGIRSLLPSSARYAPDKLNPNSQPRMMPQRPSSAHPVTSSANAAMGLYGGGG